MAFSSLLIRGDERAIDRYVEVDVRAILPVIGGDDAEVSRVATGIADEDVGLGAIVSAGDRVAEVLDILLRLVRGEQAQTRQRVDVEGIRARSVLALVED